MASISVLPKEALMRAVGVAAKQNKKVVWRTNSIIIKQMLTAKEFIDTVQDILHDCSSEDGGFAPELLDFAIRVNVIAAYAYIELPENFDELYYAAYASDLYDVIYRNANQTQIDAVKDAVMLYVNG